MFTITGIKRSSTRISQLHCIIIMTLLDPTSTIIDMDRLPILMFVTKVPFASPLI